MAVLTRGMDGKPLPRGMRLAELARRQHGVVSIRQLRSELGISHSSVERAVGRGTLHRVHHGVYAVGHRNLSLSGRCLAAVLGCGPGALLSHWSAAWLWGLLTSRPIPIHVTTPIPRRRRSGLLIHRSRTLVDEDTSRLDGVPTTSVPRTALDLAPRVRRQTLDRFLQRGEELKLIDRLAFDSVLARNRGHRGAARLRRALALYEPPPFTRSELERRFLKLVTEAGLPSPAMNYNAHGLELDAYWEREGLAVELDTFETHGSRAAFERDRHRQEELLLAGVAIDRITAARLDREPDQVIARLRALLERRRRDLGLRPAGSGGR